MKLKRQLLYYFLLFVIFITCYGVCIEKAMANRGVERAPTQSGRSYTFSWLKANRPTSDLF